MKCSHIRNQISSSQQLCDVNAISILKEKGPNETER